MLKHFFKLFLVFALVACENFNPEPELFPLEIVVVDDKDQLVQGATITFFQNEQDFIKNTNPFKDSFWKTDVFGRLIIDELDRNIQTYYINVEVGEFNNWSDKVTLKWANNPNRIVIQIKRSISNFLAGRSQRKWRHVAQTINGEDFTDCSLLRNLVFTRTKRMFSYTPAQCRPDQKETLLKEEPWAELAGNNLLLGDPASPEGGLNVVVLEATNATFKYSYQPARAGQKITVVNEFVVVD